MIVTTSRLFWWNEIKDLMTRIKIHIFKVKLPFYPPCEIKCGLQNGVSTVLDFYCFHPFFLKKKKRGCMHELRLDLIIPLRGTWAISLEIRSTFWSRTWPSAFLSTCIIHSPRLNTDCKVRCFFHTLTFAFQALSMRGILLTPYFAIRI